MDLSEIGKVKTLREVTLEMIEFIFFMAMQVGWASGKTKSHTVPLLPRYKVIPFSYKNFSVLDAYSPPHSGKSDGFTKIWFKKFPVWIMSYGGQYPKKAIPFLKSALMQAYKEKLFIGGRGLSSFTSDDKFSDFIYLNQLDLGFDRRNHFEKFRGYEVIETLGQGAIGSHWYQGMSLI